MRTIDIVRFKGGLGNQMFQFAFYQALKDKNRDVRASLGHYNKRFASREFCLTKIFPQIVLDYISDEEFNTIDMIWREIRNDKIKLEQFKSEPKYRFFWVEESGGTYDAHVFETVNCAFVGYWQTEKYFVQIREKLLQDFQFPKGEEVLCALRERLLSGRNYVSVHIRRGDYLLSPQYYGDICTAGYYRAAMNYIENIVAEPIYVFFSDDMQWVKQNYKLINAIYIEADMFKNYEAWYDMCLMSCCSHNIIANSSFSWWGAWLNKNNEKKVVAPKPWINEYKMPDICPENWIRLNNNGKRVG